MEQLYLYTNSAITSKEQKVFLIPPICYRHKLYIISDKKLYFVLSQIGKIKDFLAFTRTQGLKQTRKWLLQNKLMNESFLENISRYYLNSEIKKAYKYYFFRKDKSYNPYLHEDTIKNYFRLATLHNFIEKNKIAFNIFIERELENIANELNSIPNFEDFCKRRNYFKNIFFDNTIQSFTDLMEENFTETFEMLKNLDININNKIDHSLLRLFHISGIKNYQKSKFHHDNIRYQECLPEKTILDISYRLKDKNMLQKLINESSNLTSKKILFEQKYINSLLEASKDKKDYQEKQYINKLFSYINDSNMIFDSEKNLTRTVVIINLDQRNIEHLNTLLYGTKNKIYSLIVQSANDIDSKIYSPYGYAKLQS